MSTAPGERLGRYVYNRRGELGLNQLEVHAAGGPSNTKLTEIENGRLAQLTNQTARKLDKGLRWMQGSARATWDGGEPIPLPTGMRPESSAILRDYIAAADLDEHKRAELLRVLDNSA